MLVDLCFASFIDTELKISTFFKSLEAERRSAAVRPPVFHLKLTDSMFQSMILKFSVFCLINRCARDDGATGQFIGSRDDSRGN